MPRLTWARAWSCSAPTPCSTTWPRPAERWLTRSWCASAAAQSGSTWARPDIARAMIRIGVDFGGTKIEAAALDAQGRFQARVRAPSPGSYEASLETVRDLIAAAEREADVSRASIGVGIPGSPSPLTGLIRNANTTHL